MNRRNFLTAVLAAPLWLKFKPVFAEETFKFTYDEYNFKFDLLETFWSCVNNYKDNTVMYHPETNPFVRLTETEIIQKFAPVIDKAIRTGLIDNKPEDYVITFLHDSDLIVSFLAKKDDRKFLYVIKQDGMIAKLLVEQPESFQNGNGLMVKKTHMADYSFRILEPKIEISSNEEHIGWRFS